MNITDYGLVLIIEEEFPAPYVAVFQFIIKTIGDSSTYINNFDYIPEAEYRLTISNCGEKLLETFWIEGVNAKQLFFNIF